jgi:ABC-type multidrug transport system fused ATPase/permease subunit
MANNVQLPSLRACVGLAPQDPVLSDDTIMNLRYARPDASDADAYEACSAAVIHDKLIRVGGKYADLWSKQAGNNLINNLHCDMPAA